MRKQNEAKTFARIRTSCGFYFIGICFVIKVLAMRGAHRLGCFGNFIAKFAKSIGGNADFAIRIMKSNF